MKLTKFILALALVATHSVMAESYKAPEVKLNKASKVKPTVQKETWEDSSSYKLEEDPFKARDVASEEEEEKQARSPSSRQQPKPAPENERPRYWHLTK